MDNESLIRKQLSATERILLTSSGLPRIVKSVGINSFSTGSCNDGFSDTLFHS